MARPYRDLPGQRRMQQLHSRPIQPIRHHTRPCRGRAGGSASGRAFAAGVSRMGDRWRPIHGCNGKSLSPELRCVNASHRCPNNYLGSRRDGPNLHPALWTGHSSRRRGGSDNNSEIVVACLSGASRIKASTEHETKTSAPVLDDLARDGPAWPVSSLKSKPTWFFTLG